LINLQTYQPDKLSQFIKSFWCLQVSDLAEDTYKEDIVPDGHHEIIFHCKSNSARRTEKNNTWIQEPDSFFAGQNSRSYSLELAGDSLLYGIRFYPYTLSSLFHFPADSITDYILPLRDIPRTKILQDCITMDPLQTFANLERGLMKLLEQADYLSGKSTCIQHAVREIIKNNGDVKIENLVRRSGFSLKYFGILFKQQVGITPKSFSNIIRLNYFINYKNIHPSKSLTECAYEANFFDQSHLIRIFKEITGKSPKAHFNSTNHINNYFTDL
jgi:AraC-like DNA-binding protein